jgi:hypothetical protein
MHVFVYCNEILRSVAGNTLMVDIWVVVINDYTKRKRGVCALFAQRE